MNTHTGKLSSRQRRTTMEQQPILDLEQIEFLDKKENISVPEICQKFQRKFGVDISNRQMRYVKRTLKGRTRNYSRKQYGPHRPRKKTDEFINNKSNDNSKICYDYRRIHQANVQSAQERLKIMSSNTRSKRRRQIVSKQTQQQISLITMLQKKGQINNITDHAISTTLKSLSHLKQGSKINVGCCNSSSSSSVVVKQILGSGSYGVVVLLEDDGHNQNSNHIVSPPEQFAVKAQSPTGCLAWEYEIMQKVHERVAKQYYVSKKSPFPFSQPHSFVSLTSDDNNDDNGGALLSMTCGSSTGLNLVDIVNMYKVMFSEKVPELVALHYTVRMLKHVEMLHVYGKVLHCDIKPDNWVLMGSAYSSCYNEHSTTSEFIEASDLMLIDFGRAIDLTTILDMGNDPIHSSGYNNDGAMIDNSGTSVTKINNIKLYGEANAGDMRCVAMRNGCSWSFDVDTFGICASAHVLLFGSHIDIEFHHKRQRWQLRKKFPRYWQRDLWFEFFDTLLNSDCTREKKDIDDNNTGRRGMTEKNHLYYLRSKFVVYLMEKRGELESALKRQARAIPFSCDKLR